jgi:hypothetical protein
VKTVSLCILFLALPAVWGSTLTHDYNLTTSLNDLIGTTPLISDGGSTTGAGYAFGAQQGLNVSSALSNVGNYSILMNFSFQALGGYRKIVDTKDLASDNGLYNLSTDLNYFNFSFGPNGAFHRGYAGARDIHARFDHRVSERLCKRSISDQLYRFHERCGVHGSERNHPVL